MNKDNGSIVITFANKEDILGMLYILVIGLDHSIEEYGVSFLEGEILKEARLVRKILDSLDIPNGLDESGHLVGTSLTKTIISGMLATVEDKIKIRS